MTFTQQNQVAQALVSADINGAGASSDWVSLENYEHVTFLVHLHTHGGASTVTVANATSNAGAGTVDIAFNYRVTATTAVDDFGDVTAATAAGFATDGATVNQVVAIEIDASELTDGMSFVQFKLSDPAAAMVVSAIAVGSRGKSQQNAGISLQS